jgi:hypothetical protein
MISPIHITIHNGSEKQNRLQIDWTIEQQQIDWKIGGIRIPQITGTLRTVLVIIGYWRKTQLQIANSVSSVTKA